jgi:hypothetical protein
MLIILTKEQADKIRGRHGMYSELQPVELVNGNYGLPVEVLADEDLKDVHDFLSSLPVEEAEVKEPEMPEELQE